MNKPIAMALLVGGIIALVFGINASNSASSDISRAFTGSPTDKSIWLLVLGGIGCAAGLFGLMRGSK